MAFDAANFAAERCDVVAESRLEHTAHLSQRCVYSPMPSSLLALRARVRDNQSADFQVHLFRYVLASSNFAYY